MFRAAVHVPCVALALAGAFALKLHYSRADAGELWWVLGPTTALVERLSGGGFVFEAGEGFVSHSLRFVIAPSCAGVNFLIAAFLSLVIGLVGRWRSLLSALAFTAVSALVAWGVAVIANAARIAGAIAVRAWDVTILDGGQLHRLEGTLVYIAFLVTLYAAASAVLRPRAA